MAFKANASATGGNEFKKYIGVASFRVLGVNPTKEQLAQFYETSYDKDPVYLSTKTDNEGNSYKQIRISFMVQADPQKDVPEEMSKAYTANEALTEPFKSTLSFFLDNRYFYNKDKTKVKVIDKYGRTAWVPVEQAKNHQIPVYSNGPARIDKDYKPLYHGEEELVQFIINYLNVTPIDSYNSNTGEWITNAHPEDCEATLEHIQDYFKGDISELKEICGYIPSNLVKICAGVQTNDDGRQFTTLYNGVTLRNGSKSYTRLKNAIEDRKSNGGLANTVFTTKADGTIPNIEEYKENAIETDLSKPVDADPFEDDGLPFGPSTDEDPFAGMQ